MTIRAAFLIGILFNSLTACSSGPQLRDMALNYQSPCCETVEQIVFEPLTDDTPINYLVSSSGPKIDLGAGLNPFLAYKIPDQAFRGLEVKSWFNTSFVGPHFDPIAIYLNANKTVIGTDPLNVRYQRYNAFGPERFDSHMYGAILIPQLAQYLILTTMPANKDTPLKVKGQSVTFRISNPQMHRKIPGHWQKLTPTNNGSMEISIVTL